MLRKLLGVLAVAGIAATLAPTQADAQTSATVVFSSGAYVCHDTFVEATGLPGTDNICTDPLENADQGDAPANFYAPVMPTNSECGAGLCPAETNVRYGFRTSYAGAIPGFACAGVAGTSVSAACEIRSEGVVNAGMAPVGGPYCGWSSGGGSFVATVGTETLDGYTQWTQSAGTLLPLEVYDAQGGTLIGAGAVQTTGASPGTCGANGVTNRFKVTGFTTAII